MECAAERYVNLRCCGLDEAGNNRNQVWKWIRLDDGWGATIHQMCADQQVLKLERRT